MTRVVLSIFCAFVTASSAAAQTGAISGSVVDDAGKSLGAVSVFCVRLGPETSPAGTRAGLSLPFTAQTVTTSLGTFTFQSVPVGMYQVCALASAAGQISSCDAGPQPFTVIVSAGTSPTIARLVMGSGDVARIHIQDPLGKVASGIRLSVGSITDNGTYRLAKRVAQSASQVDFEMTIPKGRKSRLVVNTSLQVSDSFGVSVPAAQQSVVLSGPTELSLVVR